MEVARDERSASAAPEGEKSVCVDGVGCPPQSIEDAEGEQLTFEEQLQRLRKAVTRHPLHREVLYQTLVEACEPRRLSELEDFIASIPQFREATQPQYFLIQFLVGGGGLIEREIDKNGVVITEADKEGLGEDQIDDLVFTWSYETTDVGKRLIEQMRPSARLEALMTEFPGWDEALLDTLVFLREKRKLGDIDRFLRGIAMPLGADSRLQPSAFVDRLEKAGVIRWDGGWMTTEEGFRLIEDR